MIYKPTRKKERRWWAVFGALLGALILYGSTRSTGIPERSQLDTATGRVEHVGGDRYSTDFSFVGDPRTFAYASKGNAVSLVEKALEGGRHHPVTVLFGGAQRGGLLSRDVHTYPVYEIRSGAATIRSYGEIKAAWEADNRVGVWVGVAMFLCSGLLVFTRVR